jgi:hypothetical protein
MSGQNMLNTRAYLFHGSIGFSAALMMAAMALAIPSAADKKTSPAIRWEEGKAGCTFTRGDDGKYRYALWTDDFGITVAIDAQELHKSQFRVVPMLGVLMTVNYRGKGALRADPSHMTLEFVKHSHSVQPAWDPYDIHVRLKQDLDAKSEQTERESKKHPEKAEALKTELMTYQAQVGELQDFVSTRSMDIIRVDRNHPEASGWVFFSTQGKWIRSLKPPQEFVLRVPVEKQVFEFPFTLPPQEGDLILRRRSH